MEPFAAPLVLSQWNEFLVRRHHERVPVAMTF
jgi:hypothetical protein